MLRRYFVLILVLVMCSSACCRAMSRDALREAWQAISDGQSDASPYRIEPDPAAFESGDLRDTARQSALDVLNLLRKIAGVAPVELSELYNLRAQNGAMLLAANDFLEHEAPKPAGMDDAQYESAYLGTSQANIAQFNWMRAQILIDGVTYFARDDGAENLAELGHRRWMLNPHMSSTGFGLAHSQSGMSYVSMYAVDEGNADAQWDYVAWPAEGSFPVEMMRSELAWSLSLNDEIYDLSASNPEIYIKEEKSGAESFLYPDSPNSDGYCTLSREKCGAGSCIIFRPDCIKTLGQYLQNQQWSIEIRGLQKRDGSAAKICYTVDMVSLYAQDVVGIELSQTEATLECGETIALYADVIPAYADDLSIIWGSSDPSVAVVDASGKVTARSPGSCSIYAMGGNGKKDACIIEVI